MLQQNKSLILASLVLGSLFSLLNGSVAQSALVPTSSIANPASPTTLNPSKPFVRFNVGNATVYFQNRSLFQVPTRARYGGLVSSAQMILGDIKDIAPPFVTDSRGQITLLYEGEDGSLQQKKVNVSPHSSLETRTSSRKTRQRMRLLKVTEAGLVVYELDGKRYLARINHLGKGRVLVYHPTHHGQIISNVLHAEGAIYTTLLSREKLPDYLGEMRETNIYDAFFVPTTPPGVRTDVIPLTGSPPPNKPDAAPIRARLISNFPLLVTPGFPSQTYAINPQTGALVEVEGLPVDNSDTPLRIADVSGRLIQMQSRKVFQVEWTAEGRAIAVFVDMISRRSWRVLDVAGTPFILTRIKDPELLQFAERNGVTPEAIVRVKRPLVLDVEGRATIEETQWDIAEWALASQADDFPNFRSLFFGERKFSPAGRNRQPAICSMGLGPDSRHPTEQTIDRFADELWEKQAPKTPHDPFDDILNDGVGTQ